MTTTRKNNVLNLLTTARKRKRITVDGLEFKAPHGWVPGYLIQNPSIGGSEGLRRLRELRASGLPVEMRTIDGRTTREYRLAEV